MSSKIYGKLAITNLKNNRKTYVPYILMAVLSVMMYYIVGGMAQGNNGLSKNVKMIMGYMNGLLMIFSVIFLFYTNSFLIKRRKREIGIYNILGMGKGHIAKMLAIEAVITAFISIFGGILLGIVFGKLMYLVLGKLLHYDISVKVKVEIPVLEKTFVFFMAIFVLILLYNLLQIRIVSPVELLHGSNQGEREPKTKWLLAIVGAILLGTGYYIAQTTGNPLDAMTKFFFAVVCVVLGTYGLFIAGSIAVLKMLKKNKKYYYQAKHFTAVSGMVYRMKQNAVGLANICILSTMVLIMVSTTVCLYVGMNDIISVRYPRECEVTIYRTNAQTEEKVHTIIEKIIRKNNTKAENERIYHSGELTGYLDGNKIKYTGIDTYLCRLKSQWKDNSYSEISYAREVGEISDGMAIYSYVPEGYYDISIEDERGRAGVYASDYYVSAAATNEVTFALPVYQQTVVSDNTDFADLSEMGEWQDENGVVQGKGRYLYLAVGNYTLTGIAEKDGVTYQATLKISVTNTTRSATVTAHVVAQ